MKTEDTVEYNSLRWVKKELDLILHEAQTSLSAYIEDTDESDRLREYRAFAYGSGYLADGGILWGSSIG